MKMDDTLATDGDSRELAEIAKIEAGLLPGIQQVVVDRLDDLSKLDPPPGEEPPLTCVRVEKRVSLGGQRSGALFGLFLRKLPPSTRGKVLLSFDGWAGDARELHEVVPVVRFCRGVLFGEREASPDQEQAKEVLEVLLDEHALAFRDGELVDRLWLDAAGSVWTCSTAFAEEVYHGDAGSPSGRVRDYGLSLQIREWLVGRGPAPRMQELRSPRGS